MSVETNKKYQHQLKEWFGNLYEKTKALLFSVKETTQRINAVLSPTIFSKQPTYVVVVR